jgi:hypothetical protein
MRTLKMSALAFAVALGAFWAVMLQDPPKSIASDPTMTRFSPSDLKIPLDLPTLTGADAH